MSDVMGIARDDQTCETGHIFPSEFYVTSHKTKQVISDL